MRQDAANTAGPGQDAWSNPQESYVHNYAKFPHSIHEFAKRTPKTEHKPSVPGRLSNHTKSHHSVNKTSKALVQKWTYEKASIAASSIFGAVAVGAIIFLCIVLVKKFRRRRRRRKEGNSELLDEKRRQRENMMFSKSQSAREYMVEQKDGRVIRVQCTSHRHQNSLVQDFWPAPNGVGTPLRSASSFASTQADTIPHLDSLNEFDSHRYPESSRRGYSPGRSAEGTPLQSISSVARSSQADTRQHLETLNGSNSLKHPDSLRCENYPSHAIGTPLQSTSSAARSLPVDTAPHPETLSDSASGRSGSIPKHIVIVTPPLRPVTSRKAVPNSYPAEASEQLEPTTSPTLVPLDSQETEIEEDLAPTPSFRLSMFQLPSIRQSFSPVFTFSHFESRDTR
ncbi:hypothetical protein BJX70DRAFT_395520 [Aspergillus crustosus]